MFALHRDTYSLATRFVFGIAATLVLTLAYGLVPHTANAQVRIGIGIGGIGGVLLDDSYRRQKGQQNEHYQRSQGATESNSKKAAKARNQKPKKDDSKIAKEAPPKLKPPEPVASAPSTAPLTAGPPPTPDNFGQ